MNTRDLIIELGHVRLLVAAGQAESALGVLASLQRAQRERLKTEMDAKHTAFIDMQVGSRGI